MPVREQRYDVVTTRHFDSGPSETLYTEKDGEVFETVQEEEVVHRRRKATTTTKNIERRTQRDLLLEGGVVVGDTGPTVTEDVTQDTQVQETFADENLKPEGEDLRPALPPGEGWVTVPGSLVTSEKVERYVNSHQETEETKETEQYANYGDVTNEEVEQHKGFASALLAVAQQRRAASGQQVALSEPRLVNETNRKWGVVDTEDVRETSRVKDGHVVTETHRTTQQEQYDHGSAPDSRSSLSDGSVHEEGHKAHHRLVHTKDEDLLEYYAVPKGGTLAQGVKLGEGMHVVSEDVQEDRSGDALDTVGAGLLRHTAAAPPPRQDALTRRPLDYVKEERQRQHETTRWLEHHFGSDSSRSRASDEDTGGNRITITMSPHPALPPSPPSEADLRRWGPLFSTPTAGSNPASSAAPKSTVPPPPPMPHQISEARARLRSTGRTLDEIDSGRDAYGGRVHDDSYNFLQHSSLGSSFMPPISSASPIIFSDNHYQQPVDSRSYYYNVGRSRSPITSPSYHHKIGRSRSPIDSTDFHHSVGLSQAPVSRPGYNHNVDRSQSPVNRYGYSHNVERSQSSVNSPGSRYSVGRSQSPIDSPDYRHNVGRSQSFLTNNMEGVDSGPEKVTFSTQTWQTRPVSPQPAAPPRQGKNKPLPGQFSTLQSPKKKFDTLSKIFHGRWTRKQEVNLDDDFKLNTERSKNNRQDKSKRNDSLGEKENARPYSSLVNFCGNETHNNYINQGSTQFSVKMTEKNIQTPQTIPATSIFSSEAPVPPPRTKRRQRPQTTYYFGQEPAAETKQRPSSIYANMSYSSTSGRDHYSKRFNNADTQTSTCLNTNRDLINDETYENGNYTHDSGSNSHLRSKTKTCNSRSADDNEINSQNEYYNHRNEFKSSNYHHNANEMHNWRHGEHPGTNDGREDLITSHTNERSRRGLTDTRKYEEKSSRRTTDERRRNGRKHDKKGSPTVERRYKTTKTIRPVFIMETNQPKLYRSMDVLNASPDTSTLWTQTVENKKKVIDGNYRISSSLPRKINKSNLSIPSNTYVYGKGDSHKNGRYSAASMRDVGSRHNCEPTTNVFKENSSTHVLRSHSLNARPGTSLSSLRSPNLIASIARTNSFQRPSVQNSQDLSLNQYSLPDGENYPYHQQPVKPPQPLEDPSIPAEDKRTRFMEGLLSAAPELFHFMHDEEGEDTVDASNKKWSDSSPRLVRPQSAASSGPAAAPKVFTFGRDGGSTLRRGSSGSGNDVNMIIPNINKASYSNNSMSRNSSGYDSGSYCTNSIRRAASNAYDSNSGPRRQSTFNLKTEGSSLLYSPSFRERSQQLRKQQQQQQETEVASPSAGLTVGSHPDNAPVFGPVRDFNTR